MKITTVQHDNVTVVTVNGRLDFGNAKAFQTELETQLSNGDALSVGLIVDCEHLEYVSSAGLRGFLIGARLAGRKDVAFAVCNLMALVQDVFEISGFGNLMPIFTDLNDAMTTLQDSSLSKH